jgi:hypothetical protein
MIDGLDGWNFKKSSATDIGWFRWLPFWNTKTSVKAKHSHFNWRKPRWISCAALGWLDAGK